MKDGHGIIFNVQKYCIHDGPGIRTLVFLKGCPLRCAWCSNPESQEYKPEIGYKQSVCLHCQKCVNICPQKALSFVDNKLVIDKTLCELCGICVGNCPAKALVCYGEEMSVKEVIDKVEQDSIFYARSGGGMTLSGGEPLFQEKFSLALLQEAYDRRIHRAIETCGFANQDTILEACNFANYLLFDMKHSDSQVHKKFTGVGNEKIFANLEAIRQKFPRIKIHIRTPLIPGVNNSEQTIREMATIAKEIKACDYELLPYHKAGTIKYSYINKEYNFDPGDLLEDEIIKLKNLAKKIFTS